MKQANGPFSTAGNNGGDPLRRRDIHRDVEVTGRGVLSSHGGLTIPGDKSISHRALLVAAATPGETEILELNRGEAVTALLAAFERLGIKVAESGNAVTVTGLDNEACRRARKSAPLPYLNLGGSSAAARLLIGWLVGMNIPAVVDGDVVLRARPMDWLIEPLRTLGAQIDELGESGRLPVAVRTGRLHGGEVSLQVGSAQARSGVVLAAALANVPVAINHPVQSRDHTERLLRHIGWDIKSIGQRVVVGGGKALPLPRIVVPGDPSLAAYPLALHVLSRSSGDLLVRGICVNPTRTGFFRLLQSMGVDCRFVNVRDRFGEPLADVVIGPVPDRLMPFLVDDPFEFHALIDEVPLSCALAATIEGVSEIRGAEELSFKETDRFETTRALIAAFGGSVTVTQDSLKVRGVSLLRPGIVPSAGDHRIAMTATVLAACLPGESRILEGTCYKTSFPDFLDIVQAAGCDVRVDSSTEVPS